MTFRVQGEILMDAGQAKAELQATGTAARGAAKNVDALGREGTGAARGVTRLGRAADSSATRLTSASAAARANATATRSMVASNQLAAGSMGNLVAQGNDVFQMLVAGQDPLTLALQQGTQITQVIGPLGAAGAFRALGGAVLSMLSPINLIIIGTIAATAAVVDWFRSGSDEAQSFADRVEDLDSRIDSLRDTIEDASRTRVELAEEFGDSFVTRAQTLLDRIVEAEQRAAGRAATATITGFLGETDLNLDAVIRARNPDRPSSSIDEGLVENARAQLARQFELAEGLFGRLTGQNRQLVQQVLDDLADLSLAAEGTLQEQQAALAALIESYDRAAVASGSRNPAEEDNLKLLREQRLKLAEVIELQKQDPAQNRATEELLTFLDAAVKRTEEQQRANAAAGEMLGTMTQQNAIAQAIARSGSDSAEVTRLRAQFARDAALEEIEALDVSEEKKEALRASAESMFEIATTDISGTIRDAANEAARLSAEVRGAVGALIELQNTDEFNLARARINAEFRDDPVARAGELKGLEFDRDAAPIINASDGDVATLEALEADRAAAVERAREIARLNEQARPTPSRRGGRGRAAGTEAERERDNIDRLIEAKQRELDVLNESNPVQREMIRLRERLTAATPEQRAEVEALTAAHHAEIEALERRDEFEQGLGDVLIQANSLKDVWRGIGDMVLRAAKEAVLLGSGPLSGLFGGGSGGLIGGLGDLLPFADGGLPAARLPALAGGGDPRRSRPGIVLGAGTARSDSIVARVGAGEFIMTGEATARNRPVLEAMNAGAAIPGFAGGGLPLPKAVTSAAPSRARGADGADGVTRLRIEPSDLFRVEAVERARRVALEVVDDFASQQLPQRVEAIRRDPLGRG